MFTFFFEYLDSVLHQDYYTSLQFLSCNVIKALLSFRKTVGPYVCHVSYISPAPPLETIPTLPSGLRLNQGRFWYHRPSEVPYLHLPVFASTFYHVIICIVIIFIYNSPLCDVNLHEGRNLFSLIYYSTSNSLSMWLIVATQ